MWDALSMQAGSAAAREVLLHMRLRTLLRGEPRLPARHTWGRRPGASTLPAGMVPVGHGSGWASR